MWSYEKMLAYPVHIKNPCPAAAKIILTQIGGPDGELGAATRYLQQRYSMPYAQVKGMLTDIGTEELGHIEMVSAIVYQLTRCLTPEEIKKSGYDAYFVDHTAGVYPQAASGVPFSTGSLQVTGDTLADLYEDLAAEQKARVTYDNILRLVDDPDILDPIRFLREREIIHFQRFGDALRIAQENLNAKNFYAFNPSFDKKCNPPDNLYSPPCTNDCGCQERRVAPAPQPIPVTNKGCNSNCAPDCGCRPEPKCGCECPMPCCPPAPEPRCGCQPPSCPPMPEPRDNRETSACRSQKSCMNHSPNYRNQGCG